jgi:hypothetical protein
LISLTLLGDLQDKWVSGIILDVIQTLEGHSWVNPRILGTKTSKFKWIYCSDFLEVVKSNLENSPKELFASLRSLDAL